ncbi:hypothetical protein MMC25_000388 [Agyrium rufum]|nr:hypothetical protein [Agyrium rufum]
MAETNISAVALPYEEPSIITILTLSSFLLLLNIINYVFDRLLYCGLIGQIFLGIAFGTPGAQWLDMNTENVITQLGYLGLMLLIYEGGLSTSFAHVKSNISLSILVAATGICLPIALSFILLLLIENTTSLQAFAAGAALCSTSLGTTITVLQASGLTSTRLGTVLASAAILDDVVGFVMVQVISNLGRASHSTGVSTAFSYVTIVRPVGVALAFALVLPLTCCFVVLPCTLWMNDHCKARNGNSTSTLLKRLLDYEHPLFVVHIGLLLALVTGASFAGTSNLFVAYLAGAIISWWDSEVPHRDVYASKTEGSSSRTSMETYRAYLGEVVDRILKPFFFASIGFSVPIRQMFAGRVVWRGIVYSILMASGKLICGMWLLRFSFPPEISQEPAKDEKDNDTDIPSDKTPEDKEAIITVTATTTTGPTLSSPKQSKGPFIALAPQAKISNQHGSEPSSSSPPTGKLNAPPSSIYPAAILGSAMIARGEIGFLISAVAESNGIISSASSAPFSTSSPSPSPDGPSEIFLVVTWAILLCTICGPVAVGSLVRRVEGLQRTRHREVWGQHEEGEGEEAGSKYDGAIDVKLGEEKQLRTDDGEGESGPIEGHPQIFRHNQATDIEVESVTIGSKGITGTNVVDVSSELGKRRDILGVWG